MSLHVELLEQANHLANGGPGGPNQAGLRRAISAAYYALFHLLVLEASERVVGDSRLSAIVSRTYCHADLMKSAKGFARDQFSPGFKEIHALWPRLGRDEDTERLRKVAERFVVLQEARHLADYRLNVTYSREQATVLVEQAERAFADWQAVRESPQARFFLGSFRMWNNPDRTPE